VCGWWRAILYKSITNIELVFVNKNVMFGPVPVNIDRIEQIVHLAKRFVQLVVLFLFIQVYIVCLQLSTMLFFVLLALLALKK